MKSNKKQINIKTHLVRYFFLLNVFLISKSSIAQFTFTNNLRGSITPDMVVGGGGGTQGVAYLTSGNADPIGAGWLRLNNSKADQRGYFYINKSFPSTLGVLVDFEYKMWRNNANTGNDGGDGFSVFLFNAATPFQIGGYGGSLGYARLVSGTTVISEGLAGGYIGIGFDSYGNFGNNNEGKAGRIPMDANGEALVPNAVVLRGATTSTPATSNVYLSGVKVGDRTGTAATIRIRNEIDYNTAPFSENRPTDAQFYRRVQIEINPTGTGSYNIIIRWKRNITDANFTQLISYVTNEVPPALLKLGFAASTGGAFNYHEIRNIMITTPGNLRVVKKADKDLLRSVTGSNPANQNQITYTIEVTNDTDAALTNVEFKDIVTNASGNLVSGGASGDFRITSITHTGITNVSFPNPTSAAPLATNEIIGTFNIAAKATGRITVVGALTKVTQGNILNNTVTILPTDIVDQDLDNNTSTVATPVIAEGVDMVVSQTVNNACVDPVNGNVFSVVVSNMGNGNVEYGGTMVSGNGIIGSRDYARNRIELTEIIPPNTTATAVPSGWQLVQTINNSPSVGYTTRVYRTSYISPNTGLISSPASVANDRSLNSGQSAPPFLFTLKSNSQFTNQVKVRFIQERGTMVGNVVTGWVINEPTTVVELEPTINLTDNNSSIFTVHSIPVTPTIDSDVVYYCLGQIQALSATATAGNTLNWYTTQNGFKLVNAPIPVTIKKGTFKYYVSQSNGVCEGPVKEITVIVRNCKMVTNPILINKSRSL